MKRTFRITLLMLLFAFGFCHSLQAQTDKKIEAEGEKQYQGSQDVMSAYDEDLMMRLGQLRFSGDLDEMIGRRIVRVLTVTSKMFYFLDGARKRGATYEAVKEFESFLNKKFQTGNVPIHVFLSPVRRDELIPRLVAGRGDIAAANLTITPGRQEVVDFTIPIYPDVTELVVTGPAAPAVGSIDELAGKEVYVRKSSSYYESLQRLNEGFRKAGKTQMILTPANENLEDEDILELINAGLIGITVIDSHKATFWKDIFDRIKVHADLAVSTGNNIAWAFRKNSPKLRAVLDEFARGRRKGTLFGNILLKRYLRNNKWIKNPAAQEERQKFLQVVELFRKYAKLYDLDYMLITAQAYQESGLVQTTRSPAGAIGVMQVKPETAAGAPINIYNIDKLENNIHAGVKYLRFIIDRYFKDAPMTPIDKMLFAFASYNAGPARIAGLRRKASLQGLDPNVWFKNVELVAAKEIGRETVQYVGNIFKYYLAYKMILERETAREVKTKE